MGSPPSKLVDWSAFAPAFLLGRFARGHHPDLQSGIFVEEKLTIHSLLSISVEGEETALGS